MQMHQRSFFRLQYRSSQSAAMLQVNTKKEPSSCAIHAVALGGCSHGEAIKTTILSTVLPADRHIRKLKKFDVRHSMTMTPLKMPALPPVRAILVIHEGLHHLHLRPFPPAVAPGGHVVHCDRQDSNEQVGCLDVR